MSREKSQDWKFAVVLRVKCLNVSRNVVLEYKMHALPMLQKMVKKTLNYHQFYLFA